LERDFGTTIRKGQSVEDMARKGKAFVSDKLEEPRRLARSRDAFTAERRHDTVSTSQPYSG
jgi:hypothetical protein